MPETGPIVVKIDKDLEDIMPTFLSNRQKDLTELDQYLTSNNTNAIQVIAHKLAGNAGSYGLHSLGKIGATLEEACINKEDSVITEQIKLYHDFMSRLEIRYQ